MLVGNTSIAFVVLFRAIPQNNAVWLSLFVLSVSILQLWNQASGDALYLSASTQKLTALAATIHPRSARFRRWQKFSSGWRFGVNIQDFVLHLFQLITFITFLHFLCGPFMMWMCFTILPFPTSMQRERCPQEPKLLVAVGLQISTQNATQQRQQDAQHAPKGDENPLACEGDCPTALENTSGNPPRSHRSDHGIRS